MSNLCPVCVQFARFVFSLCPVCIQFVSGLCPVCVQFIQFVQLVFNLCPVCVQFVSNCVRFESNLYSLCNLCSVCVRFVSNLCPVCVRFDQFNNFVFSLCPVLVSSLSTSLKISQVQWEPKWEPRSLKSHVGPALSSCFCNNHFSHPLNSYLSSFLKPHLSQISHLSSGRWVGHYHTCVGCYIYIYIYLYIYIYILNVRRPTAGSVEEAGSANPSCMEGNAPSGIPASGILAHCPMRPGVLG